VIVDKYIGHWLLAPELSLYQSGEPPLSGSYSIRSREEQIEFEVEWMDASGSVQKLNYGGPLDGKKHAWDTPGISHIQYEKISDSILDSTVYDGEKKLMYARRAASTAGDLLVVSQTVYGENGSYSNFQVYRRKAS